MNFWNVQSALSRLSSSLHSRSDLILQISIVLAFCAGALCGCAPSDAPKRARPALLVTVSTVGFSMLPTFANGEAVRMELCGFDDLAPGDTVIYWHEGVSAYVHHRLILREDTTNRWKAKGDNNAGLDTGLVTRDVFVGRTHKL